MYRFMRKYSSDHHVHLSRSLVTLCYPCVITRMKLRDARIDFKFHFRRFIFFLQTWQFGVIYLPLFGVK